MNNKSRYVIPFFMIVSIVNAECNDFSRKSLQELKDMFEQDARKLPEYQRLLIIRNDYMDKRKKMGEEATNCNVYRKHSGLNYFLGASENNCKLAEQYEKEIFQLEELRKYAENEMNAAMPPQLKLLHQCILQREYAAIEVPKK